MSVGLSVWIDLANSPHVHVFRPLIAEMHGRGMCVSLTVRDFAQTVGLAEGLGCEYTTIGAHGGRHMVAKTRAVVARAYGLAGYARGRGFDVAVHHNSYAQALAAWTLRIPSVALMDYEHQPANHVSFRMASRVLVPSAFPDTALAAFGAKPDRVEKYDGVKEELYLCDFQPDRGVLDAVGVDASSGRALVVARPEPSMAIYHRFDNPLFGAIVDELSERTDVVLVILPRTEEQRQRLVPLASETCIVPEGVVDALSLMSFADLVLGAGGTMNREAAVLGVPVYTVFAGEMGAVDRELIRSGRMVRVDRPEDVMVRKRDTVPHAGVVNGAGLASALVDSIESVV